MGGLPVEVIYEDDQQKPEVGRQKTEKLIQSDKVDFVIGYIWSNVLLASMKPVLASKTFLLSTNAGPSQIAGELCSLDHNLRGCIILHSRLCNRQENACLPEGGPSQCRNGLSAPTPTTVAL